VIRTTLLRNKAGFTLIELMVAMLITTVGLLGLLQSLNLVIKVNLQNQLRDEAVILSEQTLNHIKAMPYANITASYSYTVQVPVRSAMRNYSVTKAWQYVSKDATASANTKQLSLRVWWKYLGTVYEHNVSSAIGKEDISTAN
jgi:type IV pilus assembly protein PilV